jgi:hypothetical protein
VLSLWSELSIIPNLSWFSDRLDNLLNGLRRTLDAQKQGNDLTKSGPKPQTSLINLIKMIYTQHGYSSPHVKLGPTI